MDVFDAIRTLLAVRSYQDTPVPDAVVRRIVEAGRLTGSGMNRQPWHFIVIRDRDTLRRLGALASSGPYVAQAPLAIVVAILPFGYPARAVGRGKKQRKPLRDVAHLDRYGRPFE
jgi:nitroreductase